MSTHIPSDSRYKRGCRCEGCRKAHADYTRSRRAAALTEGTLQHGLASTYDAGCRCDRCYGARRVKYFTGKKERKGDWGIRPPARRIFGQDGAS